MNIYKTNIQELTCTCLDWEIVRSDYHTNDPRRLCKHIINKLDIENLPFSITRFKEYISRYKDMDCGFKRKFDEITFLKNNTLLGLYGWVDVFSDDGIRYVAKKEKSNIRWGGELKPINYEEVEKYLIDNIKEGISPLSDNEKKYIIDEFKKISPQHIDKSLNILESEYDSSQGSINCLVVTKDGYDVPSNIFEINVKHENIIFDIHGEKKYIFNRYSKK